MFVVAWIAACLAIYLLLKLWQAWVVRPHLAFERGAARYHELPSDLRLPAEVESEMPGFAKAVGDAGFSPPALVHAVGGRKTTIAAIAFNEERRSFATASWECTQDESRPVTARTAAVVTPLADGRRVTTGHLATHLLMRRSSKYVALSVPAEVPLSRLPALHELHLSTVGQSMGTRPLLASADAAGFLTAEVQSALDEQIEIGALSPREDGRILMPTLGTAILYVFRQSAPFRGILATVRRRAARRGLSKLEKTSGIWREVAQPSARTP